MGFLEKSENQTRRLHKRNANHRTGLQAAIASDWTLDAVTRNFFAVSVSQLLFLVSLCLLMARKEQIRSLLLGSPIQNQGTVLNEVA